jgi:hypothetical protein
MARQARMDSLGALHRIVIRGAAVERLPIKRKSLAFALGRGVGLMIAGFGFTADKPVKIGFFHIMPDPLAT